MQIREQIVFKRKNNINEHRLAKIEAQTAIIRAERADADSH